MKSGSNIAVALSILFLIVMIIAPTADSITARYDFTRFDNVYVIVKDRGRITNNSDDWVILGFTVIGNYRSEDGETDLSDGDVLIFPYDKTADKKYNELDEGDVFKIDCNVFVDGLDKPVKPILGPTLPDSDPVGSGKLIEITSIDETSLPVSLWKYHTPQIVIVTIEVSFIVLIVMIVVALYFRKRLKMAKKELMNEEKYPS